MSEQRLIDAFEVQRQLNMSYHGCGLDGFSLGFRRALGLAIQTIENAKTIDPVRHGKWNYTQDLFRDTLCNCSVCGIRFVLFHGTTDNNLYDYCPNCGAKMEKE